MQMSRASIYDEIRRILFISEYAVERLFTRVIYQTCRYVIEDKDGYRALSDEYGL